MAWKNPNKSFSSRLITKFRVSGSEDSLNQPGRANQFDYDNNGNVITVTDIPADGSATRTTTTTYDELNRPTRIVGPSYTDASNATIRPVTLYTYDRLGNLIQIRAGRTDASGTNPASDDVKTQALYAYDDFGRKIKETDPLGKYWTFAYDVNNNPVTITDAKGQGTQYTWGYGHQLLFRSNAAGNVTYTRNFFGQPTRTDITNPSMFYLYSYDATHRLQSVTDSRGNKTISYGYSPGGLLNWMLDSEGNQTDYEYDPVGRLSGIYAPNSDYVAFRYDGGGRLAEKFLPNGVKTGYSYNADNSLSQVINRTSSGIISQHDYTYDGVGNRITHAEQISTTTTPYKYVYDELNRLKEVRNNTTNVLIEGYGYDPLNNRLTKTDGTNTVYYIYDDANQLKEMRQNSPTGTLLASLLYDDNGNMYRKTEGTTVTDITYDALNRLTAVSKTGMASQSYTYDDQGRRLSKTVNSATTNYLYNGPDILAEYMNWTNAAAQYTHGPNTDDPIIRSTTSSTQYFHQDGLGSVVAVSDRTGATTGTQRFDAWGNKLASNGTIPQYGYTGREPDETGLIYYRARYYDPSIGRFTQRDPIGMNAGINPYTYVNANPVNFTDPRGLKPTDSGSTNTITQNTSYYNNTNLTQELIPGIQNLLTQNTLTPLNETFTVIIPQTCLNALSAAGQDTQALSRVNNNWEIIQTAARANNIDPNLLAAIGIRETGFQNIPQEGGLGRGVFQIDLGQNPSVTSRQAADITYSANFAANRLATNESILANRYPNLTSTQLLQATAASYNLGVSRRAISGNPDTIDVGSARGNYGSNVIDIMRYCF
jgi:RHS repeat-associated protein